MEIAFLDANVLFSAAFGPDSNVAKLWDLKGVQLITSAYALDEARRNLRKPEHRTNLQSLMAAVTIVAESAEPIEGVAVPNIAEKDRPVLYAAVAARATHLVTGDTRHFGLFYGKSIAGVTILPPAQYLRLHSPSVPDSPQ